MVNIVRGDSMRKLALALVFVMAISAPLVHLQAVGLADGVPKEFETTYYFLDEKLGECAKSIIKSDVKWTSFSVELLSANGNRCEELLLPTTLPFAKLNVASLKQLGIDCITVNAPYPLLTPSFPRQPEYLNFYKGLAKFIKDSGLKLFVKMHNVFTDPVYGNPNISYKGLTIDRYIKERQAQAQLIIDQVRPDMLTLENEPHTQEVITGLDFSVENFKKIISTVVSGLSKSDVKVGAGAGTWDDMKYFEALAGLPLDFIDAHIYPINKSFFFPKILEVSRLCQSKGKNLLIGEAWLYKADDSNFSMRDYIDIGRKDVFSPWAPLDTKFVEQIIGVSSQVHSICTSFFWSSNFFAYSPYDERTSKLGPKELYQELNKSVSKNIRANPPVFSSTGEAFKKALEKENSKPAEIIAFGGGRPGVLQGKNLVITDFKGSDSYFDVYTMDINGASKRCITCDNPNFNWQNGCPDWHTSGNFIVFQAQDPKLTGIKEPLRKFLAGPGLGINNNIWIAKSDGSKFWQVTKVADKHGTLHVHFSPDGKKLVWGELIKPYSSGTGIWAIKVADFEVKNGEPKATGVKTYTPGGFSLYETHGFSKDNDLVLFSGIPKGKGYFDMEIYTFCIGTGKLTRLTVNADWDEHAHFTPDGKKIIWAASTGTGCPKDSKKLQLDFWAMNADGTGKHRITFFNDPKSPSYMGKVLAADFDYETDGKHVIAKIGLQTGDEMTARIALP